MKWFKSQYSLYNIFRKKVKWEFMTIYFVRETPYKNPNKRSRIINVMAQSVKKPVKKTVKRTYFGIVSLLVAILSMGFLAAYFIVSQLNISPATFYFWNAVTAFVSCIT